MHLAMIDLVNSPTYLWSDSVLKVWRDKHLLFVCGFLRSRYWAILGSSNRGSAWATDATFCAPYFAPGATDFQAVIDVIIDITNSDFLELQFLILNSMNHGTHTHGKSESRISTGIVSITIRLFLNPRPGSHQL